MSDHCVLAPVERTALIAAALRAAETRSDDPLFEDPYAAHLAGAAGAELFAEMLEVIQPAGATRSVPMTADYFVIRTRLFDDFLRSAAEDPDMRQVVLAPAGVDSRAWRLPWPARIRYFEVDRPAVLDYKQARMVGRTPRVDHRTVATDLVGDTWEADLRAAGYDPALPSTWLFEGLLYYVPEPGLHRLLDRVAALMAPGSRIAADLIGAGTFADVRMRPLLDLFDRWGCPLVFGTDEPEPLFTKHGFAVRADQPGMGAAAGYGRWSDPVPPPSARGVHRLFYVHGRRR
ncbi:MULTISPECIES: SAM-dependent methyltransferase [Protofrankia]|uniref:S-adenosyl-L-methionine-dependent methyltransferase n=1 Tax=Protofrankia coriariae TaxID=1562887 RepID=A0ABR5F1Z1_9ACTN|nr:MULTISPECIES: SAM-dependent methyltransferase [Protofrankia]KLL10668.1 hypothetical protein FrCorBMG51_16570 [Protofrankia coriariae]ONH35158.1 hypothetical protein BL254_13070 [Protofrankia sp. BMG5.30]